MDSAEWRPCRRHLIIARRAGLFGRRRWEVWYRGAPVASFGDVIGAELCVDARWRVSLPAGPAPPESP